jgi:hypothetical protein
MAETGRTLAFYPPGPWELPDRAYATLRFGAEFCASVTPSAMDLVRAMAQGIRAGRKVELVTTYTPQPLLEWIHGILETVQQEVGAIDLVINDWGVYRLAREVGFERFIFGRLLNRKRAGAERTPEDVSLPEAYAAVLGRTAADNAYFANYLVSLGFVEAEYDNVLQGHDLPPESPLGRVLHTPYVFVTTSRKCPVGMVGQPGDTVPVSGCRQQCGKFEAQLQSDAYGVTLVQTGNTLFYENPVAHPVPSGFSRVVEHARMPR